MWSRTACRPSLGPVPGTGLGDVIVLAGKGHETYQEINGVHHHLDEREIVADWFAGAKNASRPPSAASWRWQGAEP